VAVSGTDCREPRKREHETLLLPPNINQRSNPECQSSAYNGAQVRSDGETARRRR